MLALADDAALARLVIAAAQRRARLPPSKRGRGRARAASNGLWTHGILPAKSTTAAATPCPHFAAVVTAPSPTAAARSNCPRPARRKAVPKRSCARKLHHRANGRAGARRPRHHRGRRQASARSGAAGAGRGRAMSGWNSIRLRWPEFLNYDQTNARPPVHFGWLAMFKVPTVFVIGAGTGFDVGMPLGDKLSQIIGEKLRITFEGNQQTSGDSLIMEAMRQHAKANGQSANVYRRAAFRVAGGIPYSRSIDSYLHAHKDDKPLQVCGKLAIARTILEHEKGSALAAQKGHEFRDPTKVNGSWLGAFMYGLQEGIMVSENLGDIFKHLTIVNFNYDRCIEHFLFNAMQAWSHKDEREVAELMKGLRIYHPYGSVGDLPWQSGDGIEFGAEVDEFGLLKSSSRIRTFNEEVEDTTKIGEIRDAMCAAMDFTAMLDY
jgi:hypothetical protein